MRALLLMLLALLIVLFAAPPSEAGEDSYVFHHVHVVPMDRERVLRDRSVLIQDGRIASIRPATDWTPPEDARIIDGNGAYLMPGLAEMHAHVPGENSPMSLRRDILFLYLANGVTLTRGMLGEPWHLTLREQLASGEITGPRLITSGPSLNGNSVETPEQGARMVREQAEAGYDFLKLHPGLDRARFDAIAETANELGIDFAGHVSEAVGLERALQAGYASIDHLDQYMHALVPADIREAVDGGFFGYRLAPHVERERIEAIAEATGDAGVWNVPTETLMHNVLIAEPEDILEQRPEFRYLPPEMIERWLDLANRMRGEDYDREAAEAFMAVRAELLGALHDAGAGLLLGSDAPQVFNVPGFSIHHEMALMREAGLSPYEILRSGTVNPARFFNRGDDWGQVREGMRAELILVDGNPLEDLSQLRRPLGVMTGTHWLSRETIDEELAAIEERHQATD